jgi:putative transposase
MKFAFIHAEKASFPIAPMCRLLGVTRQGYYAYAGRPLPERRPAEVTLRAKVARIHEQSRGTYGSPRVLAALRASGFKTSKKRVERTMLPWVCRRAHVGGFARQRRPIRSIPSRPIS